MLQQQPPAQQNTAQQSTSADITERLRKIRRAAALKSMLGGAAFCGFGVVATALSQSLAHPGSTYTIYVGAILIGGLAAVLGFFRWLGA